MEIIINERVTNSPNINQKQKIMTKLSAIEGKGLVSAAIADLKKDERTGSRYFAVDPDEGTLLHIEYGNNSPEELNIGGLLYRADFNEEGGFTVTLLT